jgi:hypothetical protein
MKNVTADPLEDKLALFRQNKSVLATWDTPDNPAFIDIRYPAGYRIALPDIR